VRYPRGVRRRILVLGATSAIAARVIAIWAGRGARLHLVGRDADKLAAVAAACPGAGGVTTTRADLGRPESAVEVVAEALAALGGQVDLVFVAFGALGEQAETERDFAAAEAILRVNFSAVVALLVPLANHMEARGSGAIAVITSVAGERGRPRNYTYGAAKGALNVYLQGLRSRLAPAGVQVTTLKLGPVDTPMTATHAKNALFSSAARVARLIVRAIDGGAKDVFVPGYWRWIMWGVRNTPEALFQRIGALSRR
jgi:decaprenylphospho-beta-D-erythro-pentofuranosid-2-ulose 2-reductase